MRPAGAVGRRDKSAAARPLRTELRDAHVFLNGRGRELVDDDPHHQVEHQERAKQLAGGTGHREGGRGG